MLEININKNLSDGVDPSPSNCRRKAATKYPTSGASRKRKTIITLTVNKL
jgi:hypothetical protein